MAGVEAPPEGYSGLGDQYEDDEAEVGRIRSAQRDTRDVEPHKRPRRAAQEEHHPDPETDSDGLLPCVHNPDSTAFSSLLDPMAVFQSCLERHILAPLFEKVQRSNENVAGASQTIESMAESASAEMRQKLERMSQILSSAQGGLWAGPAKGPDGSTTKRSAGHG